MHLYESWSCKPKIEIEFFEHTNFNSKANSENAYIIYYVCETEVNPSQKPFSNTTMLYGEPKNSILYPVDNESKQLFLVAPTQSEPKKLDLDFSGSAHIANHFGALLTQSILNFPISQTGDAVFYLTLSNRMKELALKSAEDFLLGVLQRSLSTKIRKCKNVSGTRTVIFRDDLFSNTAIENANILSNCMSITRSLINMPANVLNPETYVDCVKFIIKQHNKILTETNGMKINFEVIDEDHLETLGCGLICAVGQGSTIPPRLLKLTAHPTETSEATKHIAFVGKGITYDTGGYSLKPSPYMRHMKKDMGGSAAALGSFFACAKLNLPVHLSCFLPLAENMVSGNAMRPGDIYKAYNGMHIEIDNTDAEGRLVLADALSLAAEEKPDWIIDLATLTGAARSALGPLVDPVFGNRKQFTQLLEKTSIDTGDWVWPFPLPSQYNGYLDSKIADMMNSGLSPFAGAITAALFLQKFVGSIAWTHIDTYMWTDRPNGMWGEDNAPTAKCVRLITKAIQQYCDENAAKLDN